MKLTLLPNKCYYSAVGEAHKLVKERIIHYYNKSKAWYDAWFLAIKFKVGDDVTYEEFYHPNAYKLTPPSSDPYKILHFLPRLISKQINLAHIFKELLKVSIILN